MNVRHTDEAKVQGKLTYQSHNVLTFGERLRSLRFSNEFVSVIQLYCSAYPKKCKQITLRAKAEHCERVCVLQSTVHQIASKKKTAKKSLINCGYLPN